MYPLSSGLNSIWKACLETSGAGLSWDMWLLQVFPSEGMLRMAGLGSPELDLEQFLLGLPLE